MSSLIDGWVKMEEEKMGTYPDSEEESICIRILT